MSYNKKQDLVEYEFINLVLYAYYLRKEKSYLNNICIPKNIIKMYYRSNYRLDFDLIVLEFKEKYIFDESRIDNTDSIEEKLGLGEVYDYISKFNFDNQKFDIFIHSLIIHQKLYSKCPGSCFGGSLREAQAILKGINIDIISAEEAKIYFNSFINNSDFIFDSLNENDILKYIEECIKLTTDLIKAQPFNDGNKRTFRALLNLLFKKIDIPPIYIDEYEIKKYKTALFEAISKNDYTLLVNFYYYKICDSIIDIGLRKKLEVYEQKSLKL